MSGKPSFAAGDHAAARAVECGRQAGIREPVSAALSHAEPAREPRTQQGAGRTHAPNYCAGQRGVHRTRRPAPRAFRNARPLPRGRRIRDAADPHRTCAQPRRGEARRWQRRGHAAGSGFARKRRSASRRSPPSMPRSMCSRRWTRARRASWYCASSAACRTRKPRRRSGISVITCKREWASAKAWLKQELSPS